MNQFYIRPYSWSINGGCPCFFWVGVKVPAIISKELFNKVQDKIDYFKKKYRNPRIPQLLSNLIRCGCCGGSFFAYRRYYIDRRANPPRVYHRASYKCNWRVRILQHAKRSKLPKCDNNEIKTSILEEKVLKMIKESVLSVESLKKHMDIFRSEGRASQGRLQRQLVKINKKLKELSLSKKRLLEVYVSGATEHAAYTKSNLDLDNEINELTKEKIELTKQIPLLHKKEVIDLSIAQHCDEMRVRLKQCKDFETTRQFMLDFIDHIVYYKNLVELHGYVPVRSDDPENSAKIEYKVIAEIEWAERMANFKKKLNGSRISVMDFNNLVGQSKRRMRDMRLFSQNKKIG